MEHLVGSIAAACTTICFIPQAIKVVRTKHTQDISLWMYIIFSIGVACWLTYGLLLTNYPIIIANIITLPLALTILYTKIKYG